MTTPTLTAHSSTCCAAFGRKDTTCPRCQELIKGAPARTSWQAPYYARKKREAEATAKAMREHDCKKHGCNAVCTAFQW